MPDLVARVIAGLRTTHDRLGVELSQTGRRALADGAGTVGDAFAAFAGALRAQLALEERLLLTALDGVGAPTASLRAHQHDVEDALDRAGAELAAGDAHEFSEHAQELLYALYAHGLREERLLVARAVELRCGACRALLDELQAKLAPS